MAVDDSPDKEIADVITERKDHLQAVAERLTKFAKNVIVLKGGMGAKQRQTAALATVPTARNASPWRPADISGGLR